MTAHEPLVAVVVSTRNRSLRLTSLLESLVAQTLPKSDFEVVVVDDSSADDTPEVLASWVAREALSLKVVSRSEPGGPAAGRNEGWRTARAPLVAFTDDDCEAAPDWLRRILEAASEHPGSLFQGRTEPIPREVLDRGPYSRTIEVRELGPYYETCNIAYRRETLELVGGFDELTFRTPGGEDTDLALRAIAAGVVPRFVEDALVHHAVNQLGPVGMLKLALRWSDAMAAVARHPTLRATLHRGIFWKRSHEWLLLALVGAILSRRFPPTALLAIPYLRRARHRARKAGGGSLDAAFLLLYDLLEMFATVRGGITHGRLII